MTIKYGYIYTYMLSKCIICDYAQIQTKCGFFPPWTLFSQMKWQSKGLRKIKFRSWELQYFIRHHSSFFITSFVVQSHISQVFLSAHLWGSQQRGCIQCKSRVKFPFFKSAFSRWTFSSSLWICLNEVSTSGKCNFIQFFL